MYISDQLMYYNYIRINCFEENCATTLQIHHSFYFFVEIFAWHSNVIVFCNIRQTHSAKLEQLRIPKTHT